MNKYYTNFNKNSPDRAIPEILSPAGNFEALTAAVRSGADAVYLGANIFSARQNAGNFHLNSGEDGSLEDAIKYCHVRGCRVYLTLNTLITQDELPKAFELAKTAYLLGVDGIIIQDLGLAALLKKHIPKLALNASTQLSCHNAQGVKTLVKLGFKRVILAREMSKEQIKKCIGLGAEIEVFVHGALCMSVSGQCLISANLGGRSGNRGLCAQTCRLPFNVGEASDKSNSESYALSLKDLSLIDKVDELCEMGVASFKIEGRMKRPEYVAAATSAFVAARNRHFRLEGFPLSPPEKSELEDVFSRSGFTNGYFENSVDKAMFGHRRYDDVISAKSVLPRLSALYKDELKRVPLELYLSVMPNIPAVLSAYDFEGNSVTIRGSVPETALNKPLDKTRAVTQLEKSGNTPFIVNAECEISDGLTIPISAINSMRREAFAAIEALRGNSAIADDIVSPIFAKQPTSLKASGKIRLAAQLSPMFTLLNNSDSIASLVSDSKADLFIFPINSSSDLLSESVSAAKKMGKKIGIEVPRGSFLNSFDYFEKKIADFKNLEIEYLLIGNIGDFELLNLSKNLGFKTISGFSLNVANSSSAELIHSLGVDYVTLSSELSLSKVKRLANDKTAIFAYGKQPLMMLRNCPARAKHGCENCFFTQSKQTPIPYLTDRKGIDFQLNCYKSFGYVELLNSRPLYLADDAELSSYKSGLELLYFTDESASQALKIISDYKNSGNAKRPENDFTRGLFKKGVL